MHDDEGNFAKLYAILIFSNLTINFSSVLNVPSSFNVFEGNFAELYAILKATDKVCNPPTRVWLRLPEVHR